MMTAPTVILACAAIAFAFAAGARLRGRIYVRHFEVFKAVAGSRRSHPVISPCHVSLEQSFESQWQRIVTVCQSKIENERNLQALQSQARRLADAIEYDLGRLLAEVERAGVTVALPAPAGAARVRALTPGQSPVAIAA